MIKSPPKPDKHDDGKPITTAHFQEPVGFRCLMG